MKLTNIVYWIATILLALLFTFSAYMALTGGEQYLKMWRGFGYPDYLPALLGPLKALAVIGLLIPRRSFLKHWVYAGLAFDLLLAILAHQSLGHDLTLQLAGMFFLIVSYFLYLTKVEFKSFWNF